MNDKVYFILKVVVAFILVQTLYYKFSAHPDSVYIFESLGLEPVGRIGIGIFELISGALLLIPKTVWLGALLTFSIIGGAIMMHLTLIGIEVNNDKGILFITALITFMLSVILLVIYKKDIPLIGNKI